MAGLPIRIAKRLARGERFALAVILETRGSAPQVPGAAALVSLKGKLLEGTVGGGPLEADIVRRAFLALRSGKRSALIVDADLRGSSESAGAAVCGGTVKILIDPRPERDAAVFQKLRASLADRHPGILATGIGRVRKGSAVIRRAWLTKASETRFDKALENLLAGDIPRLMIARGKGLDTRAAAELMFLEPVLPPFRLVIAGAGHIGRAVAHLGRLLDFEVTVIDDRPEFACRRNLPDADRIIRADIGRSLGAFPIGRDTFVVIVTRGHRDDAEALRACINSPAGYVGMIGSRRKIALIRREFLAKSWAPRRRLDGVHAPIGLAIGSKTVQEIAVSIAAELIAERRKLLGKGSRPRRSDRR